jgi:adenylate cyclase
MADAGPTAGQPVGSRRLAVLAAIVAIVSAVTIWFATTSPARLLDGRILDLATTTAPAGAAPEVVIVAIDEPSFADLGLQWPWPRSVHARLIESLRAAGARTIGVDLVFAEPSRPEEDAALAAVLGPDVVLAADETLIDTPEAAQLVRTEPLTLFTDAGAASGLANMPIAPDGSVREMPPWPDSFAVRVLAAAGREAGPAPDGATIALAGPARTYRTVSYYQALEASALLPPDIVRDRIVLVGLSLQTAPTVDAGGADAFSTAWTTRTGRLTSGVELHANVIGNLLAGTFVRPVPAWLTALVTVAAALAAGALVLHDTRPRTVVWGALGLAGLAAATMAALVFARAWSPPATPAFAFLAVLSVQGVLDYARERRTRRAITTAFRHYLAPELVERLARDPSLLRLGGERRTLTVLFCDVRGFTTIAEGMKDDPHRLTRLVNSLLDPLSEEVLRRGGTIDKYIGDCVMAFWNAPLDDPDHAVHAVDAALAMARAARRFGELAGPDTAAGDAGPLRLSVGIGINTGDAVVGNMGSSARFDYTAIGDAVNLAARLETLCRTYEVAMVIGEETRSRVADRYVTAFLDRVAVKGRGGAEAIHTVLGVMGPDLARRAADHDALVTDIRAGRATAEDPRLAGLALALPDLAPFYRTLAASPPPVTTDPLPH